MAGKPVKLVTLDVGAGLLLLGVIGAAAYILGVALPVMRLELRDLADRSQELSEMVRQQNEHLQARQEESKKLIQLVRTSTKSLQDAQSADCQGHITRLALRTGLEIEEYVPLAPAEYPGLGEMRCQFDAMGTWSSILTFLEGIEKDPAWMDISFLSMQTAGLGKNGEMDHHLSIVTSSFNFFTPADASGETGK